MPSSSFLICLLLCLSQVLAKPNWPNEDSAPRSNRTKRFAWPAIGAIAGVAGAVFGGGSFAYGIINGQQRLSELNEINRQLTEMNTKLDHVSATIGRLELGQEWQVIVSHYASHVQRIDYFRHALTQELHVGAQGALEPMERARAWAEQVLDPAQPINAALFYLHNMVMGQAAVFGHQSVVELFKDKVPTLPAENSKKYLVELFSMEMIGLQVAGYASQFTALNMVGREEEVPKLMEQMKERLDEQAKLMTIHIAQSPGDLVNHEWGTYFFEHPDSDYRFVDIMPVHGSPPRHLRGCHLYQKGNRLAIRCYQMDLKNKDTSVVPDWITDTLVENKEWGVVYGQDYGFNIDYVHDEWTCVPNEQTQAICGVRLTGYGNRLALKVLACSRNLDWMQWIDPKGWGAMFFEMPEYIDAHVVVGEDPAWMTCIRLINKGNRLALELKQRYILENE